MTLTFKLTPPQLILDAVNLIASYGRALRTATPQPTPQNATSAKMSTFGGAGLGQKIQKPNPPERGSFPLDHDGECKDIMLSYLRCIKSHRGSNDPECRNLSKSYLSCRMDRNLMAPDSFKNLGFGDDSDTPAGNATSTQPSQRQAQVQDRPRGS
ncbi:hypothetical protein HBH53_199560 [Parastagonospora nodorum]|nr:hypothetical protein HBH53_199560 [Parastagonospora nodorum]KAH5351193.1 hypothetical protein HBI49_185580 [Parastagonospora nodorum]KAH5397793.1 hypothetical protein HBI32_192020 [Parastagonospora nodorum]KAH5492663.1 hypothetical protein HBI52_213190 [Parastagonospora nodorum]